MSETIVFVPKYKKKSKKNLHEFIRMCREDLTVFGSDLNWEDWNWPSAKVTFCNVDTSKLHKNRSNKTPMKKPFIDFAKAYFRYQVGIKKLKSPGRLLSSLRCLESALLKVTGKADLNLISRVVLDEAAIIAKEHYIHSTAYSICAYLVNISIFISDNNLISSGVKWKNPLKYSNDRRRVSKAADAHIENQLPNEKILDEIAQIFASNPKCPKDIITSSVCALLMCAPSRISEIVTLEVNCEIEERDKSGQLQYGWRFRPGKGAAPYIKWIPKTMVPIAKEAMSRLRKITEEGRRIAKHWEESPNEFYRHSECPNVGEEEPLSASQLIRAIGTKHYHSFCSKNGISLRSNPCTLSRLAAAYKKKLPKDFPWFDRGRRMKFSEALFCAQEYIYRVEGSLIPNSIVMCQKITSGLIIADLSASKKSGLKKNIFERHGHHLQTDKVGTRPGIQTHKFRHYLNTLAQKSGQLTQWQIARWSGRMDVRQNEVYDHMTVEELRDLVKSHDQHLTILGGVESFKVRLPVTRDEFNRLTIPNAHITEFGFCVHDYSMLPCQKFLDCLNCQEHLCIKGDPRCSRLVDVYKKSNKMKEQAVLELQKGTRGADRWYDAQIRSEERLKELISIINDPSIPSGSIVMLKTGSANTAIERALETRLKINISKPLIEP